MHWLCWHVLTTRIGWFFHLPFWNVPVQNPHNVNITSACVIHFRMVKRTWPLHADWLQIHVHILCITFHYSNIIVKVCVHTSSYLWIYYLYICMCVFTVIFRRREGVWSWDGSERSWPSISCFQWGRPLHYTQGCGELCIVLFVI